MPKTNDVDWSRSELFYVPSVERVIKEQKLKCKSMYQINVKQHVERSRDEYEQKVAEVDEKIRLRRLLAQNKNYTTMNSKRQKLPSYFEPEIMRHIVHDAHLLVKYSSDPKLAARIQMRADESILSLFSSFHRCQRFNVHSKKFDNREFLKAISCEFDLSDYKTNKVQKSSIKSELSSDISSLTIESIKKKRRKANVKLPDIDRKKEDDYQNDNYYDYPDEFLITSIKDGHLEKEKSINILRPKGQNAIVSHLKLPKIHNAAQ